MKNKEKLSMMMNSLELILAQSTRIWSIMRVYQSSKTSFYMKIFHPGTIKTRGWISFKNSRSHKESRKSKKNLPLEVSNDRHTIMEYKRDRVSRISGETPNHQTTISNPFDMLTGTSCRQW